MPRLDEISFGTLEEALENADGKKETMRLLVALIYKRGPSVPMLAEWLNIRKATIYRWFDRMESEPIEQAIQDRPKSGRPSRLTDEQRQQLADTLDCSPRDFGYGADEWTPSLVQEYVLDEFGIEYSERHMQRLIRHLK